MPDASDEARGGYVHTHTPHNTSQHCKCPADQWTSRKLLPGSSVTSVPAPCGFPSAPSAFADPMGTVISRVGRGGAGPEQLRCLRRARTTSVRKSDQESSLRGTCRGRSGAWFWSSAWRYSSQVSLLETTSRNNLDVWGKNWLVVRLGRYIGYTYSF